MGTERGSLVKSTGTGVPRRRETGRSSECEQVKESPRSPHHLEAQGQEILHESQSKFWSILSRWMGCKVLRPLLSKARDFIKIAYSKLAVISLITCFINNALMKNE